MADDGSLTNADLVDKLKQRLHIFHSVQDTYLDDMISSSIEAIEDITGCKDEKDVQFTELVIERCRYAYNDSVEFFNANFQSNLMNLSAKYYDPDKEEGDGSGTETNV